ncbi:MAG: LacI family transcriptional regulator [Blastochloris sp.]|nr:LacI family transcriptional regulator [Blastochloris sp.]
MPNPRPTIRHLADSLGLSPAAVSMALRNHPRIGTATRQRVQQAAEAAGYRSDPLMTRLMTQLQLRRSKTETEVLALVMNYQHPHTLQEVFLQRVFTGIQQRSTQLGYKLEHFNLATLKKSPRQLSTILYNRGIQGVILAPFREGHLSLKLDFKRFATVIPSGRILAPLLHSSTADQFANMLFIMRRLSKFRYRRIGFYTNQTLDRRSNYRFSGAYLTAIHHASPALKPLICIDDQLSPHSFLRWLEKTKPEALVTTEALTLDWLQQSGRSIPADLSIAFTSVSPQIFPQPVSGIDEQPEQIGSAAVDLLSGQLNRHELGIPVFPKVLNVEGTWTGDHTLRRQD